MNVVAINNDVAHIGTYSKLNSPVVGSSSLLFSQSLLNVGCAPNCIHDDPELHQKAVAHRFDDAPTMFLDFWVNESAPHLFQTGQRPLFIKPNEATIASDIRR